MGAGMTGKGVGRTGLFDSMDTDCHSRGNGNPGKHCKVKKKALTSG